MTVKYAPAAVGHKAITLEDLIAGETNEGSASNAYLKTRDNCNTDILAAVGPLQIGGGAAGDTNLLGIRINAALTGTLTINGFRDTAGNAVTYVYPAGTPANDYPWRGGINTGGALTFTFSDAADYSAARKVAVDWRPI